MKAFLLTWNPKYYDPHREVAMVRQSGYCISHWSSCTKKIDEGHQLYLMRQGVEPRGIVAYGEGRRQDQYIHHEGRWFAPLCWYYFKADEPIITVEHLKDLYPDQHWEPRQSGIEIKPPTSYEFMKLIDNAIGDQLKIKNTES